MDNNMNWWNVRSLPYSLLQTIKREQRAYKRRLLKLEAHDRRWRSQSRRIREDIKAAYAATLPLPLPAPACSPSNKLRPWQSDWNLNDEEGFPR